MVFLAPMNLSYINSRICEDRMPKFKLLGKMPTNFYENFEVKDGETIVFIQRARGEGGSSG